LGLEHEGGTEETMIYYLIGAFWVFALLNYRLAVLLLAPFALLLHMFPAYDGQYVSILDFCCLGLTVLLPIKTNFIAKFRTYPFMVPSLCVLASYVVTNLLGEPHWPSCIFILNTVYVYPFIVWCVFEEERDLKVLVYGFAAYMAFCIIYAMVELALGENPILEKIITMRIVNENVLNYTEVRFGLKRLQSVYNTPMSMGLALGAFGYFLFQFRDMTKNKNPYIQMLMVACLVMPWLTGSRSVFAAVFILLFPIMNVVMKEGKFMLFKIGLIGGAIFILGDWMLTLIDSFIHSDTAVAGSSLDMRLMQFAVIIPFFLNSPIWGSGYAYTWTFVKAVDADLLGAESIWLQLLVDFGLLGAIAYTVCIVYMAKSLKPVLGKGRWALPMAVIVGYTLSTFLGLDLNYFFILCMMLIKTHEFSEKTEEE
jgi:hypothetical protein